MGSVQKPDMSDIWTDTFSSDSVRNGDTSIEAEKHPLEKSTTYVLGTVPNT